MLSSQSCGPARACERLCGVQGTLEPCRRCCNVACPFWGPIFQLLGFRVLCPSPLGRVRPMHMPITHVHGTLVEEPCALSCAQPYSHCVELAWVCDHTCSVYVRAREIERESVRVERGALVTASTRMGWLLGSPSPSKVVARSRYLTLPSGSAGIAVRWKLRNERRCAVREPAADCGTQAPTACVLASSSSFSSSWLHVLSAN